MATLGSPVPPGSSRRTAARSARFALVPVGVIAVVLLVVVRDLQARHRLVQLLVRREQSVRCADLDGDCVVFPQVRRVLLEHLDRRVGHPLRDDVRANLAVLDWKVEEEWRVLRVRGPRSSRRQVHRRTEAAPACRLLCLRARLDRVGRRHRLRIRVAIRRQAARAHEIEAEEHVRPLHADPKRAVATHRMTGQSAAHPIRERAVVAVHVRDEILGDESFPVACRR